MMEQGMAATTNPKMMFTLPSPSNPSLSMDNSKVILAMFNNITASNNPCISLGFKMASD